MDPNEPIQDTSWSDNGPDPSGVPSDFNNGRIGVTQAINNPFAKLIRVAARQNWNFLEKKSNSIRMNEAHQRTRHNTDVANARVRSLPISLPLPLEITTPQQHDLYN